MVIRLQGLRFNYSVINRVSQMKKKINLPTSLMEIDRMSYIFGSFTRHRQNEDVSSSKKRTILPKVNHDRSKSTPHTPKKSNLVNPRAKSVCNFIIDEANFKCTRCQRLFIEPKVLPCLHTFCLRCLQELEANDFYTNLFIDAASTSKLTTSIQPITNSTPHRSCPSSICKQIFCPTCGARAEVPYGGVSFYPPNYLLQHRMVLFALNAHTTNLLCDMCTSEVSATARCMDCALSFCEDCKRGHLRQVTENHEVLSLEEARTKGITTVRRQLMCILHPELELELFCSTCSQVLCSYCVSVSHKGHSYEPVSKAFQTRVSDLRFNCDKAKGIAEQSALAANRLFAKSKTIETQCGKVELEIEEFIEKYIKSIQDHRKNLLEYVKEIKNEKLQEISKRKLELHKKVKEARDVAFFLDELLSEGSDVEVMSFFKPVMNQINKCRRKDEVFIDPNIDANLLFLPQEVVPNSNLCPLYGVVTTQTVSLEHSTLTTQVEGLRRLCVGKKAEIILETKDQNGVKLNRGGETISGDLHYKNANGSRCLLVNVKDNRDGTYNLSFVPDVAGKLILNININGHPIKDSPFPIIVRSLRPHHGTFHCCSFCSSGGSKEASCGCGGKMPGGYKGCGHGHDGHPGRRHWSCCGNILENSECIKPNSSHYQFTL